MPKKTDALEQAFNFPSVIINGVEGVTVFAATREEAETKLTQILNKKSDD